MEFFSTRNLAAVVEAARFFTYVGQCWHNGYIDEPQMEKTLRDEDAYANWKRYDEERNP